MNTKLGLFTQILKSSFYFLWSNRLVPIFPLKKKSFLYLAGVESRRFYIHLFGRII